MNRVSFVLSVMQDEETTDCCVTKEFHSVQCIFYPVKEEEREVPIESTVTSRGTSTSAGSSAADQPELQSADGSLCECLCNCYGCQRLMKRLH